MYKPNWDRAKIKEFKFINGYDVPFGTDRNGKYGELMPDGLVASDSHFERLDDIEGIGRLSNNDCTASFKFGDCYYGFNDNYYDFASYNHLEPGKYKFFTHDGTCPFRRCSNPCIINSPLAKYDREFNNAVYLSRYAYYMEQNAKRRKDESSLSKDNGDSV